MSDSEDFSELGIPGPFGADDPSNMDQGVFVGGAPANKGSVEDRLAALLDTYQTIANCCRETGERMDRLERHTETMRQALLQLARKIDVQTGYGRY